MGWFVWVNTCEGLCHFLLLGGTRLALYERDRDEILRARSIPRKVGDQQASNTRNPAGLSGASKGG